MSARFALRYLGHREGVPLGYFTGASVDLVPGASFDVPPEGLVLGRRGSADLRVASAVVAPAHLRARPVGELLELEDLHTTNGSEVDGAPLRAPMLVRGGARVTLAGGFFFEVIERDAVK